MQPRRLSAMQVAFGVSLAAHAVLLAVKAVGPPADPRRPLRDAPLEVVLVNARGAAPPSQARALAQASLSGGGDVPDGRAASPLPPSVRSSPGNAADDARRGADTPRQADQHPFLARLNVEPGARPQPPVPRPADESAPDAGAPDDRARPMDDRLAVIDRQTRDDDAPPRRRYVGPATREVAYALYYDRLRQRVEERGTRHFPAFEGKKLYGELTMNLTVDAEGRLLSAEVVRPSDSALLDRRAIAIVEAAAPFGAFTTAMRREADQLVIGARFRFSREEGDAATLEAPR